VRASILALWVVALASSSHVYASSIDRELLRRVLATASPALAECGLPAERHVVRLVAFERVVFPAFEPPRPASSSPRPGEPRSHLPPAARRVGPIVITWPFVVREG
jgi:hypothetical protein